LSFIPRRFLYPLFPLIPRLFLYPLFPRLVIHVLFPPLFLHALEKAQRLLCQI
jgi:hypothetical protein